jgi:transposase InsO family protein
MQFHSNAATNLSQRHRIRNCEDSLRILAKMFDCSATTIQRWKKRDRADDNSSRPKLVRFAFTLEEERLILTLRKIDMSLDDILDELIDKKIARASQRSSVHRLLKRNGLSRLPSKRSHEPPKVFREYPPGYLHIDHFTLPLFNKIKHYCFVAIDRATRMVYLRVYPNKSANSACDFITRCVKFFHFPINTVLTDNGREFTSKYLHPGSKKLHTHLFDLACDLLEIEHRLTRPYTPSTNGMVERTNGRIKRATIHKTNYVSIEHLKQDFEDWMLLYNFVRPHRRLNRKTPASVAEEWGYNCDYLFVDKGTGYFDSCNQPCET